MKLTLSKTEVEEAVMLYMASKGYVSTTSLKPTFTFDVVGNYEEKEWILNGAEIDLGSDFRKVNVPYSPNFPTDRPNSLINDR